VDRFPIILGDKMECICLLATVEYIYGSHGDGGWLLTGFVERTSTTGARCRNSGGPDASEKVATIHKLGGIVFMKIIWGYNEEVEDVILSGSITRFTESPSAIS
jgi:hypothetical protein